MTTDLNIIQDFDTKYNEAYYAWDPFYPLAERDLRFYLGDQWDEREKRELYQEGRSTFVFNHVRRTINMVTGYQRKHRLSSVVVPQEDSDQKTADQLSQLLLYVAQYGDLYQKISDCFGGALKTGWNLLCIWVDYRDDPINGDIKFAREPYNGFITDPYLTSLDLSDCNYILRRKYLSAEHVASLLPGQEKDVFSLYKIGWERDDKFTWLPYQRQPNGEQLMAYNEMYQQKWKNVPVLIDMETGETTEFDMDREMINLFLDQYPQLKVIQRPKRYIEKHIIVNDEPMKTEINPYDLDEYPFALSTAIFEPESDQWGLKVQSLIRCIVDPQRESNRRRSQMSDLLDSQINSGWIAVQDSVINPSSLFQTAQGKVIWKKADAPQNALEKIPPGQIPPSSFQLQELYDRDMVTIAGVNDASFGQIETANDSGVMMMLRQGAAITNLQDLFDNLRHFQKTVSKKVIKLIQNWGANKVRRILNEEPTKEFYNKTFTKYDISVQEGILTDTQKQMNFRQLLDMYQITGGAGQSPITPQMLYTAAPIQGKSKTNQEIEENQKQQAQQAQQAKQVQQQVLGAQMQQSQAKAISDIALGKERFTRAVANMGLEDERSSKAIQDRADSALSRVRAMKELEQMDDDRVLRYFNIIRLMEEMNRQKEEQIKEDDISVSARATEVPSRIPATQEMVADIQQSVQQPAGGLR